MAKPLRQSNHSSKNPVRRIIGIDPGSLVTGWGVIETRGSTLVHLGHGAIASVSAARRGQADRLSFIYRGIQEAIKSYRPDGLSLERIFFARNAQSALKLGQARGVALLAAAHAGIPVHEYTASEIKLAVVGYGHATKDQVQKMVAALLKVSEAMACDASDALAAAICHLHRQRFQSLAAGAELEWTASLRRRRWSAAAVKRLVGRL
jgi:crossover junction endodeoxyribonuclease RuvC